MREIRMLRVMWRGLETELRSGLHGHERGNPGHRQGHDLTDHRASPRPYRDGTTASTAVFLEPETWADGYSVIQPSPAEANEIAVVAEFVAVLERR